MTRSIGYTWTNNQMGLSMISDAEEIGKCSIIQSYLEDDTLCQRAAEKWVYDPNGYDKSPHGICMQCWSGLTSGMFPPKGWLEVSILEAEILDVMTS